MCGRFFLGHFAAPYFPIQGLPIITYCEVDMGAVASSDDFPGMTKLDYVVVCIRNTKLFFRIARSSSARLSFVANSYSACISKLPSDLSVP